MRACCQAQRQDLRSTAGFVKTSPTAIADPMMPTFGEDASGRLAARH